MKTPCCTRPSESGGATTMCRIGGGGPNRADAGIIAAQPHLQVPKLPFSCSTLMNTLASWSRVEVPNFTCRGGGVSLVCLQLTLRDPGWLPAQFQRATTVACRPYK